MEKLIFTFCAMAVLIWVWKEYFREIPHLEQAGVLKNFRIESVEPHHGRYLVIDRRFVAPDRQVIHPASPMVRGFQDLAYVSNVDVMLTAAAVKPSEKLEFDEVRRCYFSPTPLSGEKKQKLSQQTRHLSLIAATAEIAKKMQRLTAGQQIELQGDVVQVYFQGNQRQFFVGTGSTFAANCQIFRVNQLRVIH